MFSVFWLDLHSWGWDGLILGYWRSFNIIIGSLLTFIVLVLTSMFLTYHLILFDFRGKSWNRPASCVLFSLDDGSHGRPVRSPRKWEHGTIWKTQSPDGLPPQPPGFLRTVQRRPGQIPAGLLSTSETSSINVNGHWEALVRRNDRSRYIKY